MINCSPTSSLLLKSFARIFAVVVIFSMLLSCQKTSPDPSEVEMNLRREVPATEVSIATASTRPFQYFVSSSGTISSAKDIQVQFARGGIVEKVMVENGEQVKRGQLIAVLINKSQKLNLSKSEIVVKEKQIAFDDQMLSYDLLDSAKRALIAQNVKISSGLASAEIAREESKYDFENSFVRAQQDGVVSGIKINSGGPVNQGDLFCFIHDPKDLLVEADVLESDAVLLSKGVQAEISPLSSKKNVYKGVVVNINPRVDIKTGLVRVAFQIVSSENLFPGMHVNLKILLPFNRSIVVPKTSIVIRSGRSVVFTAVDKKAYWNFVETGRENGVDIEILNGLNDGDKVIIYNNLQLAHDAPITIVNK